MIEPDGPVNILLVDDRPDKLLAIEAVLEELHQNVVRAYSGREALRRVLHEEFAVILLDVNMPGMDGFETASLIRQRKNSEHVPIIFITAFADEMHVARGYSLGAVDYILTPVVPEVLRTKVAVFVDLFKKTAQVTRQAESLRRRAAQLQKLAAASVAINGALSIDRTLQTVTDTARDVAGAHQAITLFLPARAAAASAHRPGKPQAFSSFSDKYADWRGRPLDLDAVLGALVARGRAATRLSEAEVLDHPDWDTLRRCEIPPLVGGMLAAPLTGRHGDAFGALYLADRYEGGPFTNHDEALLVQLAQIAATAIENSLFAEEREANRIKDEFLATLSHELRTPLNAILGWTQLLAMEELDEQVGHGLEVIERNAKAQTKLIEDLLDVSRITTGKLRLSVRPIALVPVVRAALDAIRPAADAKAIRIDAPLPGDGGDGGDGGGDPGADEADRIVGDPDRLQQVAWNLLSNAVKFTPAGGTVRVELGREGDRVTLRISDTGPGIAREFLPYVFDRFRQADSTSTRAHGGLGIGLTVVRHIVELHGGTVTADSAGEGHGATFTATLPASAGPPPAAPASESPGAAAPSGRAPADNAPAAPPIDLEGLRVLLVDDEPDAREVAAEILRRSGAEVSTAGSAREALEIFARFRPAVLVSDIAMPDQDGYSLIRTLRGLPGDQGGGTPAVALTAYAREDDRCRALSAGFHAHLSKPVEPAHLAATIAHVARPAPPPAGAQASREEEKLFCE